MGEVVGPASRRVRCPSLAGGERWERERGCCVTEDHREGHWRNRPDVRSAIADLETGNWLQVIKIGAGRECAYVLNDRVAWADKRDNLRLSRFSAQVIADADDQNDRTLSGPELQRLPDMFPGERQLPAGDGLPPISQPFFDGMEPDLPAIERDEQP